ncbi:hypothetical protein Nmel_004269, partial [Mimus melanotis]
MCKPGEVKALASDASSSQGEAKHVSSFASRRRPSRVAGQQIHSSVPCRLCRDGVGDEAREGPEEAGMGTALQPGGCRARTAG